MSSTSQAPISLPNGPEIIRVSGSGVLAKHFIISQPPPSCLNRPVILGIDEAGRGPVLGPMTYACAYWSVDDDAEICKLGFNDSKQLKESDRDKLLERLKADGRIGSAIEVITPEAISAMMMQRVPISLNAISHDSAMNLIRTVMDQGVQVSKVFVDTVGDPGSYQAKLQRSFDRTITFTVSKKADSLYKTVSAASICAKVTRDAVLRDWTFKEPLLAAKQPEAVAAAAAAAAASASADSAPKLEPMVEDEEVQPEGEVEEAAFDANEDEDEDEEDGVVIPGRAAKRQKTEEAPAAPAADKAKLAPAAAKKPSATSKAPASRGLGARSTDKGALHPKHSGSGYPGDPATKQWLDTAFDPVFGWPSVLRFSWSTAKERLDGPGAVSVEWEEDLDDGKQQQGGASSGGGGGQQIGLGSFFAATSRPVASTASSSSGTSSSSLGCGARSAIPLMSRPAFFRKRNLKAVTDFL